MPEHVSRRHDELLCHLFVRVSDVALEFLVLQPTRSYSALIHGRVLIRNAK